MFVVRWKTAIVFKTQSEKVLAVNRFTLLDRGVMQAQILRGIWVLPQKKKQLRSFLQFDIYIQRLWGDFKTLLNQFLAHFILE